MPGIHHLFTRVSLPELFGPNSFPGHGKYANDVSVVATRVLYRAHMFQTAAFSGVLTRASHGKRVR